MSNKNSHDRPVRTGGDALPEQASCRLLPLVFADKTDIFFKSQLAIERRIEVFPSSYLGLRRCSGLLRTNSRAHRTAHYQD